MKSKMFAIAVLLLVVTLPARAHQNSGTPIFSTADCNCDCQDKNLERVAVGSEEANLNKKINQLVDSVQGKLDLPENADVATEVEQLIEQRDRLADKRRNLEAQYTKCLKKRND